MLATKTKRDELARAIDRLYAAGLIRPGGTLPCWPKRQDGRGSDGLRSEGASSPSQMALLGRPYRPGELWVEMEYPRAWRRKGLAG